MTRREIIGWKTYAVGVLSIICGSVALARGHVGYGLEGIIGGLALIALRDAIGKILRGIDGNRTSLNNMRAAIETLLSKRR